MKFIGSLRENPPHKILTISSWILGVSYCLWAIHFIRETITYIPGKGNWYCLFDDAMISMRYALNWAHGLGLVWNPGERVEGFTNFLQVAVMAAAIRLFGARIAPLAIQLLGLCLVLGTTSLIFPLSRLILLDPQRKNVQPEDSYLPLFAATATLLFYPLSYWSLMGMETGILSFLTLLLTLFSIQRASKRTPSLAFGFALGLMTLARPDSLPQAMLLLILPLFEPQIWRDAKIWKRVGLEGATFALLPLAMEIFRWTYYGRLVPNTYTLKMTGWPLALRLESGVWFTFQFLKTSWLLEILALCYVLMRPQKEIWLLWLLHFSLIVWQAWAGGDPWLYWRIYTPSMPLLIILATGGAADLSRRLSIKTRMRSTATILLAGMLLANYPFMGEILFKQRPDTVNQNKFNVRAGLELHRIMDPKAQMAVFWAGSAPYYCGCRAIDMLGKCDAYIARLPVDPRQKCPSVPGHNKYDLHYSIEKMQPDMVENFRWQNDHLDDYKNKYYVHFRNVGWLRKDSQLIRWDLIPQSILCDPHSHDL